jgi:cytochrome c-type biogenesis protein CcmH
MRRHPWRLPLLLCCLCWLLPASGAAGTPATPNTDDPVIDARLHQLAADLRCVVCQNESLAESRASLAVDLREEIREMMRAGLTDDAVVESLVARYGDFVLYRPPVKPLTYALWAGPFVFLLLGAGLALATLRRRQTLRPQARVSPEALREAGRLLRADADDSRDPDSPSDPGTVSRAPYHQER